jgi:Na+/H+-dicarboxylate symporter
MSPFWAEDHVLQQHRSFYTIDVLISVFHRDRIRTTNNMLGDCYAAAVVEHLSKQQLKAADTVTYQVRVQLSLFIVICHLYTK